MMDEQEFQRHSDKALQSLANALANASDEYTFESDFNAGALTVEFDDPPGKFVVSPQSATRQIWVSAQSKSFKLDWQPEQETFVLLETKQNLRELMADQISQRLGEPVSL